LTYEIRFISEPPCSPPEPIEHGLTDWDGKSGVAKYACFQGYHLVGPPQVRKGQCGLLTLLFLIEVKEVFF